MKHWRWYLIGVAITTVFLTAPSVTIGFVPAGICLLLWASRIHVIYEPRWTIDDELPEILSWT